MILLIESLIGIALFTLIVVPMGLKDPLGMIGDYPPAIKKRCEDLGLIEKRETQLSKKDLIRKGISKYEGNLASPPIELLRSYATVFNISMDELLGVQPSGCLSLHGLSENQIELLTSLANVFKGTNHNSISQDTYSTIGKIAVELARLNLD